MENKYLITETQLKLIGHYRTMFEFNAESIKTMCHTEKGDVAQGFELGQRYSHLIDCYLQMTDLEDEIKEQQFIEKK